MDRLSDRFDIMNSSMRYLNITNSSVCVYFSGEETEPTFNLRLIEAVKQSTCLYDQNDRQYRCADIKMKVGQYFMKSILIVSYSNCSKKVMIYKTMLI